MVTLIYYTVKLNSIIWSENQRYGIFVAVVSYNPTKTILKNSLKKTIKKSLSDVTYENKVNDAESRIIEY